ncbi:MAG TPA: S9 family peptidase [Candidatus Acidoferrales bacterium]|nr:S9 family peptidase [Candidatus Acidoferrales bacterium]
MKINWNHCDCGLNRKTLSGNALRGLLMLVGLATLVISGKITPRASAQSRRIQLNDFAKQAGVSDPEISPDGKSIAFVISRANVNDDRHDRELYVIDIASGASHELTFDRRGVASPRWSPRGDCVAFLAPVGPEGKQKDQIFVLSMSGGEAEQITRAPNRIEQFAWRPDGKDIAYVTSDVAVNEAEIKKHNDAFEIGNDSYLLTAAPTPSHLWLVSADGGKPRRLTSGAWSLPKSNPPGAPASPISWSPNGHSIVFGKQDTPHLGDGSTARLQIVNVDTGEIRRLTQNPESERNGLFSPDGSKIAYFYSLDGDRSNENEVFVTSAAGGNGRDMTRAIDRNVYRALWMPDSKSLLVGAHDGTHTSLWMQPIDGAAKKLNIGDLSPSAPFWIEASVSKDGAIAFSGTDPSHASELYYMASADSAPKRLTDFNAEIAALNLGKAEEIDWQNNGFHEDGVVIYPPDFDKDKKYPLVLLVHGGPRSSTGTGFSFWSQLIASHDYVVFEPNYRGSDNLGNAYQRAIAGDAGDGPGRDVMAGIAELENKGFVDTSRIAVSGWSYGGYMTAWMTGHYHIWKTAIAGAPVTNEVDQYNLADFNVGAGHGFGGSPWVADNMKKWEEQSPITYAAKCTTPTLILQDTGDFRVTLTQGFEWYHALKDNGTPVRFFVYPTGGHFPSDPVRQTDIYRRWMDWLDQYLK